MHVLVVCTGNICRLPTAERLLLARAAELGVASLTVGSAGTRAVVGYGMEATACVAPRYPHPLKLIRTFIPLGDPVQRC